MTRRGRIWGNTPGEGISQLDAKWRPICVIATLVSLAVQVIVDPAGPFPFTEAGVRSAFRLQESRHAHGKVVVLVEEAEGLPA